MPGIPEPSPWMVALAPTLLSLVVAALYAAHREFKDLHTRLTRLEEKVDALTSAWWEFIRGSRPSS